MLKYSPCCVGDLYLMDHPVQVRLQGREPQEEGAAESLESSIDIFWTADLAGTQLWSLSSLFRGFCWQSVDILSSRGKTS